MYPLRNSPTVVIWPSQSFDQWYSTIYIQFEYFLIWFPVLFRFTGRWNGCRCLQYLHCSTNGRWYQWHRYLLRCIWLLRLVRHSDQLSIQSNSCGTIESQRKNSIISSAFANQCRVCGFLRQFKGMRIGVLSEAEQHRRSLESTCCTLVCHGEYSVDFYG